MNKMQRL